MLKKLFLFIIITTVCLNVHILWLNSLSFYKIKNIYIHIRAKMDVCSYWVFSWQKL